MVVGRLCVDCEGRPFSPARLGFFSSLFVSMSGYLFCLLYLNVLLVLVNSQTDPPQLTQVVGCPLTTTYSCERAYPGLQVTLIGSAFLTFIPPVQVNMSVSAVDLSPATDVLVVDDNHITCFLPVIPASFINTQLRLQPWDSAGKYAASWFGLFYSTLLTAPTINQVNGLSCSPSSQLKNTSINCDGSGNGGLLTIEGSSFGNQPTVTLQGITQYTATITSATITTITIKAFNIDKADVNTTLPLKVNNGVGSSNSWSLVFVSDSDDNSNNNNDNTYLGLSLIPFIVVVVVIGLVVLIILTLIVLSCCCGVSLAFLRCCCRQEPSSQPLLAQYRTGPN